MSGSFFYPYFSLLHGAAWNIQQSLEGLGMASSENNMVVVQGALLSSEADPGSAAASIFYFLLLFSFVLVPGIVTAGYVLGRKKGALFSLIALLLPGSLGLLSLWPIITFTPDNFVIGGHGMLGSGLSMLPLVVLAVSIGWCIVILLVDIFDIGETFVNFYDHLWYAVGLLAGIFFVADSRVNENYRELQDSSRTIQQASNFLLKQTATYDQWCRQMARTDTASCRWASDVQQRLLDYSIQPPVIFSKFGPVSSAEIYALLGRNADEKTITAIRAEISAYNQKICPVTKESQSIYRSSPTSSKCVRTPASFCTAFPDPIDVPLENTIYDTAALASECIIPTLVRLHTLESRRYEKVEDDDKTKHLRWLYYLIFSIVAGGKIALTSAKLFSVARRPAKEKKRAFLLISHVSKVCWRLFLQLLYVIIDLVVLLTGLVSFFGRILIYKIGCFLKKFLTYIGQRGNIKK